MHVYQAWGSGATSPPTATTSPPTATTSPPTATFHPCPCVWGGGGGLGPQVGGLGQGRSSDHGRPGPDSRGGRVSVRDLP